ncbi:DUF2877 domain-containing protein [Streptomyces antnestii]|uniref:DUF2877 domain-containing protein n=1 Tax=Streptomyces antnestii TaxID=2494256 RepID=A0A437Q080_9ACTN|nr:DUF2877 domain-containing protein [Streptomyces sp. San01]RVU27931.1 DUF2877 domain-containing protein [Streptomyces sp. San01]
MPSVTATGTVRTRSGDAALLAHLRTFRGQGVVEGVFRRTVNILMPDDMLISLSAHDGADAPRTLITDVDHWSDRGISPGQAVLFTPPTITLGAPATPTHVQVEGAGEWHPITPSLANLGPDDLTVAAHALDRLVREHGSPGGLLGPSPAAPPMEVAVTRALAEGRDLLTQAVASADEPAMRRAFLALIGLGPGLTPSGDDFLTALALLSALPGSGLTPLARVLSHVLREHPGRTTRLSAATLDEALRGRALAPLLDLVHTLSHTSGHTEARVTRSLRNPVRDVLAIGHTSGTDILSGLVTGLRLEKELRGSL